MCVTIVVLVQIVPVLFTVNGKKIRIYTYDGKDPEIFIDSGKLPYPYIVMNDGCSVLAKARTLHEHSSDVSTEHDTLIG